jgi:hypothetical protein
VLLQTHHNQLTTTPAARSILTELKEILYGRVKVNNLQPSLLRKETGSFAAI